MAPIGSLQMPTSTQYGAVPGTVCALLLVFVLCLLGSCGDEPSNAEAGGGETKALMPDRAAELGLTFRRELKPNGKNEMPEIVGSGAAIFDADGDGRLDIYFLNAGSFGHPGAANRLFLQRHDQFGFREVEGANGLGDLGFSMGVAVGDVDADGDTDVFLANYGENRFFLNDGKGHFKDVTQSAGIVGEAWSTCSAFVDMDADGDLDLYVVNYVHFDPKKKCEGADSKPEYCGPKVFRGVSDQLYLNDGKGKFKDVSKDWGLHRAAGAGFGIGLLDFNEDGRIDVFVANDGEPNNLWINGASGMTDQGFALGVAMNGHGEAEASMGVALGDVDMDGHADLFCTHLATESHTLYRRDGAVFKDATTESGLGSLSLSFTGFGTQFGDLNGDGAPEIVIANGRVKRGALLAGAAGPMAAYAEPNQILLNDGKGRFSTFEDGPKGLDDFCEVSRGLAMADLDGDGDLDIVVTNSMGPARVHINEIPQKGHWLQVSPLQGSPGSLSFGARVTIVMKTRRLRARLLSGNSYLTSVAAPLHFGLGSAETFEEVLVEWSDGLRETFPGGKADQFLSLRKGKGKRS